MASRVLVDPKGQDCRRYAGAWLVSPYEAEALSACGAGTTTGTADLDACMQALRESIDVRHRLVTRGERGTVLYSADRAPQHVQVERRGVYDVSGAGDMVLAASAAGLAAGQTLDSAMRRVDRAAALAVGKFGTATVSAAELGSG